MNGFFLIEERKFYLANGFNFDYETTTVYNITFTANDGISISDPVLLCLEIINVNESPSFRTPMYYVTFQENEVHISGCLPIHLSDG